MIGPGPSQDQIVMLTFMQRALLQIQNVFDGNFRK